MVRYFSSQVTVFGAADLEKKDFRGNSRPQSPLRQDNALHYLAELCVGVHEKGHSCLVSGVSSLRPQQGREAHKATDLADTSPTDKVRAGACRRGRTIPQRSGVQVYPDYDRPHHAVARSGGDPRVILQAFNRSWVARFGVPRVVTSDRGAQFTSKAWKTSMEKLGISVALTTSYHPQSNGLVERFHRSLKNSLRCAVTETKSWTRALPWVLLGLRNVPRTDTAASAAEVLYSTPLRVPGLCFVQDVAAPASEARKLHLARTNVSKYMPPRLEAGKFRHSPFVAKDLRRCKFVFLRDDSFAKPPLAPRYSGPHQVINKNWKNNAFTIRVGQRTEVVSIARLKAAMQESRLEGRDVGAAGPQGAQWQHALTKSS